MAKSGDKVDILAQFSSLDSGEKLDILEALVLSMKQGQSEVLIPVSIFDNDSLSIFQAVVVYLKENHSMRFVEIGKRLHRSDKTIWVTYKQARKKFSDSLKTDSSLSLPLSIFSKQLTLFEAVVSYLKSQNFTNHQIAVMLKRDDRTIWSVYDRAKKKQNVG